MNEIANDGDRRALEAAQEVNRRAPDDITAYGLLADAHAELGNCKEAEQAAQWMLDLRPGNVPGLTRGAYLRERFGDLDGALDFMQQALQRTRPEETEDRAWLLTHIAHLHLVKGDTEASQRALEQALRLFPEYHYALAGLARVRSAQQRHAGAVELLRRRYQAAPHPENLYELAEALGRAGRKKDARAAYAEFERKARAEMDNADNSNRELILYYAGPGRKPAEALRLARREVARRRDVNTLDAYAWGAVRGRAACGSGARDRTGAGGRDPKIRAHAQAIRGKG